MLTVNPLLWGFASYSCIKKYPGTNLLKGTTLNSLLFISEAIISDLVFFAGIQKGSDKLMHPTTFYGWGFVATVPFIIYLLFKDRIRKNKEMLVKQDFKMPLSIGLFSLAIITLILVFNIQFH
jgi:EamA domain-containing membrane protein RarD